MMTDKAPKKGFDCIKFTRDARKRIYEETKHLSREELHQYWRRFRENDPFLQQLEAFHKERSRQGG